MLAFLTVVFPLTLSDTRYRRRFPDNRGSNTFDNF